MSKSYRTCEITQECKFGWTLENVAKYVCQWTPLKDYAYILHDKDKNPDTDDIVEPHIHLLMRFSNPVPTDAIIARGKAVDLPQECLTDNRIQKMHSWSAANNYLTHRDENKAYKHVYDVSDIVSNYSWESAAAAAHEKKILSISPARAKEIVEQIDNGIIREYNIHEFLNIWEQVQYNNQIGIAFKKYLAREKLKGDRNMQVVFICGPSGIGKDTFARELCNRHNFVYYNTSNNDNYPFDDYKGQPAVIWSDARDNIYKPQQIFALLDNHWKSSQKARYSDINLDCKMLIITSIKPLEEWYMQAFSDENEDRKQLYRRIKTYCVMDLKSIYTKFYNETENKYVDAFTIPNKYSYENTHLDTAEKRKQFATEIFGGLIDTALFTREQLDNLPAEYFDDIIVTDLEDEKGIKINDCEEI